MDPFWDIEKTPFLTYFTGVEIAEKTPKAVPTQHNPGWRSIGGTMTVLRHQTDLGMHELLWGSGLHGNCSSVEGEAPIASLALSEYALPLCTYSACNKVNIENISDHRVRVSYSSHKSEYGESAAITIHGPANVTFTNFSTSQYRCDMKIGSLWYSGSSLPPVWNVNDGTDTMWWSCSFSGFVSSWIFEVDYAEDSKLHIDIPLGTVIPADATKLVLVSKEANGCLEAPISDYNPTLEIAESVDFKDMDECHDFLKGDMNITRRLPLPKEDHEFRIFLVDSSSLELVNKTMTVKATSEDRTLQVKIDIYTRGFALWVFAANATGQAPDPYKIRSPDYFFADGCCCRTPTHPDCLCTGASRKSLLLRGCLWLIGFLTLRAWV